MPDQNRDTPGKTSHWIYVLRQLVVTFGAICLLISAYLFIEMVASGSDTLRGGVTISLSLLFGVPYALGAITAFLSAPNGNVSEGHYTLTTLALTTVAVLAGSFVLHEAMICIVLLLPLWWLGAIGGAMTVKALHRKSRDRQPKAMSLVALPFVLFAIEPYLPETVATFSVERTVVIEASMEEVWPHLLAMPDIAPNEGRFTIAQSLMGIPRPSAAIVVGEGPGAIREARWGKDIYFEEHIDVWRTHDRLEWAFAFPDDSVSRYTDRHITVDGPNLYIDRGGYQLERLPDGRTKLTLFTQYRSNTPVNHYSAVWGEIFLGGIQMNVLEIVRDRSEALHSDGTGGSE